MHRSPRKHSCVCSAKNESALLRYARAPLREASALTHIRTTRTPSHTTTRTHLYTATPHRSTRSYSRARRLSRKANKNPLGEGLLQPFLRAVDFNDPCGTGCRSRPYLHGGIKSHWHGSALYLSAQTAEHAATVAAGNSIASQARERSSVRGARPLATWSARASLLVPHVQRRPR